MSQPASVMVTAISSEWSKRKKKIPLCAIYSFGSHLQNKLNCQDETLTATAGKDTSCSTPATPQTTKHFLLIYLVQLWSWTSQNNKVLKWTIDTSWQEEKPWERLQSVCGFIFYISINVWTVCGLRGCFQVLRLSVKVWSSVVHVA